MKANRHDGGEQRRNSPTPDDAFNTVITYGNPPATPVQQHSPPQVPLIPNPYQPSQTPPIPKPYQPYQPYQPPPRDHQGYPTYGAGRGRGERDNQGRGAGRVGGGGRPGPRGSITCEACGRKESHHWPDECRALTGNHPWANPNYLTITWAQTDKGQEAIAGGYTHVEPSSKKFCIDRVFKSFDDPEFIEGKINQLGHGCITNIFIPPH